MKKYVLHFSKCLIVRIFALTAVLQSIQAQEPAPSTWNSFINNAANPIVSDTFRMQTFGGKETDNWRYTLSGDAEVTDRPTLKLPLASQATFDTYTLDKYTDEVTIGVNLAFSGIKPQEKLTFDVFRQNSLQSLQVVAPAKTDSSSSYKMKLITQRPTSIAIIASQPVSESSQGYFAADRVFAFGNIPQYSLFTGSGNWNDTTRWSHLPPLRHRKALINGEVTSQTNIQCEHVAVNNGNVHISSGTTFRTNNLILYSDNSTLSSEGTLAINNQVIIHKTFEEKGKWYFISFPFDVYTRNIASPFVQKDATPNNGGNFFYVQTYNGEKRATSNQSSGNWEVLPIRSGNTPVFEKNKGYLIALDEKATTLTLTVSSEPGNIPSEFANKGSISISVSPSTTGTNKENYGWYLCGNPFPHPLVLSVLENTSMLDGYAYLFQNGAYKAFPLNSDYAIPPYSAFFVKSEGQTEIKIKSNQTLKSFELVQPSAFTASPESEPDTKNTTSNVVIINTNSLHFTVKNQTLQIENIPEQGYVEIFNITGNCLLKQTLQEGSSSILLTLKPGVYLARLTTGRKQEIKKFILL